MFGAHTARNPATRNQRNHMLTRTHRASARNSSVVGRSASIRRMRRRSLATRLYCRTNGCASFLELQPETALAVCPLCGYTRTLD